MATGSVSLPNGSITTGLDTVTYTTVITTNLQVTNIKALDGTASASVADTTGAWTFSKPITVSDTTQSTSTTTGAIIAAGGAGIAKDVYVGGVIAIAVGAITTPAYTFSGDLNTGMWSSAADTLDFSAGGLRVAQMSAQALSVNYLQLRAASAGGGPLVAAVGGDTNIPLEFYTKGTGTFRFFDAAAAEQFRIARTASAVNRVQVTAGATGVKASVSAVGETNVDLGLSPAGTGVLDIVGTATAGVAVPSTHTLNIKINGSVYKVLLSNA